MFRRTLFTALLALLAGPALAQSNDPSFRVVNNTGDTIESVFASPANQRNWGEDRLGDAVIRPGATYIIRLPAGSCVYDVRVVYEGGRAEERRNVNTCNITNLVFGSGSAQAAPNAGGGNPSFYLVNQSGRVIESLFASPSSQENWGPDRLGDNTVRSGQRHAVRLPAGECLYDLRIVFQGGDAQERRRVNACNVNEYVVR